MDEFAVLEDEDRDSVRGRIVGRARVVVVDVKEEEVVRFSLSELD